MATALQNSSMPDAGAAVHASLYPRSFMTEFDLQDNRYPSLSARPRSNQNRNLSSTSADMSYFDRPTSANPTPSRRSSEQMEDVPLRSPDLRQEPAERVASRSARSADTLSKPTNTSQSQDTQSYPSQEEMPRRDPDTRNRPLDLYIPQSIANGADSRPRSYPDEASTKSNIPLVIRPDGALDRPMSGLPNTPRHPDVVASSSSQSPGGQLNPIMPLSASPSYNPPIAPRNRTYPQQPTYIKAQNMSSPVNAVYTPVAPPQEEVCLECAMRDQDMADVDVTTPGVWDRASDAQYEELRQRELEEEESGVEPDERRPRYRGGRLTEPNLKLWLSINPREPASRMQTLTNYVRSQRALLEAEALAHAKAMKEAAQLDSRMRDTYSQLRRSAYDIGNASAPVDDTGGVRIKPPTTPTSPYHSHTRSQSREVTLLENGMIVEHVDVRKEEREARERRRKEERRARKPSRSSVMDASIISANSSGALADGGLKPYSAYSNGLARPLSELNPQDRPDVPRAYSQASFSDVHSLGSASPRRPKFFGMRNLSTGWRSQDSLAPSYAPSGMSGSMVDMHVALQREDRRRTVVGTNNGDSSRISAFFSSADPVAEEKAKKKKSGLIKWWQKVTGSNRPDSQSRSQPADDDLPLAPPPPLSYLVNRSSAEVLSNGRHNSSSSVPSVSSPKFGQSLASSPTTQSPPSPIRDADSDARTVNGYDDSDRRTERTDDAKSRSGDWKVHSAASEPNLRHAASANQETPPPVPPLPDSRRSVFGIAREKSLPPLPKDEAPALPTIADRPATMYTYDPRTLPPGTRAPHDFLPPNAAFRTADSRRQSFSGTASRSDMMGQTLPPFSIRQSSFSPQYDEFGRSLGSFNPADHLDDDRLRAVSPQPSTTKRKSKFGFASLLGKKSNKELENSSYHVAQPFPTMQGSYESATHASMRTSIVSRKPLDELVAQDPEFVAYRYPSTDARIDLLK